MLSNTLKGTFSYSSIKQTNFVEIFYMNFTDLNIKKPILNALNDLGFSHPTTIQEAVFPVAMSGKDVIGLAQTGTGKTLSYLIPLLNLWKFTKEPHPQILIIVPTRELVVQVVEAAQQLTQYMNVAIGGVYGGANINTQAALVLQGLDVLVGTPGRVFDLAANGSLQLKMAKKIVIDEVDETLSLGFRPQLLRLFEYLPTKRQHLVFSATLSEEVEQFIQDNFTVPITVEASGVGTPVEQIELSAYETPNFYAKQALLEHLLIHDVSTTKVLVFVSSRTWADTLFEALEPRWGDEIGVIHSNKSQNFRFNAVKYFDQGEIRFLIATDLIARGIDISNVTHVINFDLPQETASFLHRVGRTGRANQKGKAITFYTPKEQMKFNGIEEEIGAKIERLDLPEKLDFPLELHPVEQPKPIEAEATVVSIAPPSGPAFHEKKAKNKKVNVRYNHKAAMREKYGKPKSKGSKKKK